MTEPKPNIRPGVRGICRNGFWTPPLEATCSMRWPWKAAGMSWSSSGCYRSDGLIDAFDIIGIVEDLPPVPSPQQKSYWRLLDPGEFVTKGDEFIAGKTWCKTHSTQHGVKAGNSDIYRRRVPAQETQTDDDESSYTSPPGKVIGNVRMVPAEHYVPPAEFAKLKEDAAKWREHVANPQPAPQILGMPEGWEVDPEKTAVVVHTTLNREPVKETLQIPIRRIKPPEPVCVYPLGQLKDGWLFQHGGANWFSDCDPSALLKSQKLICAASVLPFRAQPKWRDDVPESERCVKVGPEAEKGAGQ